MAAARSWQAMPTWSIWSSTAASRGRPGGLGRPGGRRAAGRPWVSWQTSRPRRTGAGGAAEEAMPEAVITGGARTAIGRLLGSFKDLAATDLGGIVIKAALERSGITGGDVQYVIMGQVLQ